MDLRDYRMLRAGGLYRVRRSFTDYNARSHRVGEQWTFLGYREDSEAIVFFVRTPSGEQRAVPLLVAAEPGVPVAADLSQFLVVHREIPEDHRLWCGCGLGGAAWGEVLRTPAEVVRLCDNCRLVVALHPAAGGYRLLELDDVARQDVVYAARIPANVPLPTLLGAVSTRQTYPANLLLGRLLAERVDLNWELGDILQRGRPDEILLTLEFLAQLTHVPEPLDAWIVQLALTAPLGADDDLVGWSYEALRHILERVGADQPPLEELARRLRDTGSGEQVQLPDELLMALDERVRQGLEERNAASAVLQRLAGTAKWDEAVDWLQNWAVTYPASQQLPSRALLAEEAADALGATTQRAAHWLYEYALALYDHAHSAPVGHAGVDQHYPVQRLRHKLKNLEEHTKKERSERHVALSTLRSHVVAGQFEEAAADIDEWVKAHPEGHALLTRAQLAEEAADGLAEHSRTAASWLFEWARAMFEEHARAYSKSESSAAKSRHVRRVKQKLAQLRVYWKQG
jgi:hypothetical protein